MSFLKYSTISPGTLYPLRRRHSGLIHHQSTRSILSKMVVSKIVIAQNYLIYTDILSEAAEAYFDVLPRIHVESSLPPSSPPPPSPRVKYAEKETQMTKVVCTKKRKAPDYKPEAVKSAKKARKTMAFEVNVHIHCGNEGSLPNKGMGNSVLDPIVV